MEGEDEMAEYESHSPNKITPSEETCVTFSYVERYVSLSLILSTLARA